jgi:hypothetical protein
MKKVFTVAALLCLIAAAAFAAGNATLFGNYYQNATNGAVVDTLGKAIVVFGDKESDFIIKYRGCVAPDSIAPGSSDSTRTALTTYKAVRSYLVISANMTSPSLFSTVRLAVRVTGSWTSSISSDSTFNFPLAKNVVDFTVGTVDSLNLVSMNLGGAPTLLNPTSTEYVVQLSRDAQTAGMNFPRPASIAIPLIDRNGMWIRAPYLNVLIRPMQTVGATGALNKRVPIRVDYFGYTN